MPQQSFEIGDTLTGQLFGEPARVVTAASSLTRCCNSILRCSRVRIVVAV